MTFGRLLFSLGPDFRIIKMRELESVFLKVLSVLMLLQRDLALINQNCDQSDHQIQ